MGEMEGDTRGWEGGAVANGRRWEKINRGGMGGEGMGEDGTKGDGMGQCGVERQVKGRKRKG